MRRRPMVDSTKSLKPYSFTQKLAFQILLEQCVETCLQLKEHDTLKNNEMALAQLENLRSGLQNDGQKRLVKLVVKVAGLLLLLGDAKELQNTDSYAECALCVLQIAGDKTDAKETVALIAEKMVDGGPFDKETMTTQICDLCCLTIVMCKRGNFETHKKMQQHQKNVLMQIKTKWMATELARSAQIRTLHYNTDASAYISQCLHAIEKVCNHFAIQSPVTSRPATPVDRSEGAARRQQTCTLLWRCTQYFMRTGMFEEIRGHMSESR